MQELATWVSGGKHSSRGNTMQRPWHGACLRHWRNNRKGACVAWTERKWEEWWDQIGELGWGLYVVHVKPRRWLNIFRFYSEWDSKASLGFDVVWLIYKGSHWLLGRGARGKQGYHLGNYGNNPGRKEWCASVGAVAMVRSGQILDTFWRKSQYFDDGSHIGVCTWDKEQLRVTQCFWPE